jgi:hypothetical protein
MSKNIIYTIVIVVCFLAAAVVAYKFILSPGGTGISDSEMTWVKCNNPACKAEYEMSLNDYLEEVKKRMNPMMMAQTPAITCEKCGKDSVYKAKKCPNCGTVFIEGISGASDFSDRCPVCKQSATEESRKKRLAERNSNL